MSVLIIDDDKEIRESLQDILEDEGFSVVFAENGEQGLEVAIEQRPSVILLDLLMPVMDGKAFREKQVLDSRIAAIPTIIFSASGKGEISKVHGVSDYLKKPIDLTELLKILRKYIQ